MKLLSSKFKPSSSQSNAKAGRSKITDFFELKQDKAKLSKMEVAEKNFDEEIEYPIGVE